MTSRYREPSPGGEGCKGEKQVGKAGRLFISKAGFFGKLILLGGPMNPSRD